MEQNIDQWSKESLSKYGLSKTTKQNGNVQELLNEGRMNQLEHELENISDTLYLTSYHVLPKIRKQTKVNHE